MEKLKTGILYLGLYSQLASKYGRGSTISRKELFCKLGKHGQIPKNIRHLVIKEMEEKGFLKQTSRDNIEILVVDVDLERDAKELYKIAGIY